MSAFVHTDHGEGIANVRFSWLDILTGNVARLLRRYEADGWQRLHIIETPDTSQRFSYFLVKSDEKGSRYA